MNQATGRPLPATNPDDASELAGAEAGYVVLDGLPGLAATLTPDAAARLGQRLIDAAEEARVQRL